MDGLFKKRKGQVFSIDVLFALLPIVMIIGASLQYLYIAEEDLKTVVIDNTRETASQGLAQYIYAHYQMYGPVYPYNYITKEDCTDLKTAINWPDYRGSVLDDYPRYGFVWSYHDDERLCNNTLGDKNDIFRFNNTISSQERFMLEYDSASNLKPGHIAGVSIMLLEDT